MNYNIKSLIKKYNLETKEELAEFFLYTYEYSIGYELGISNIDTVKLKNKILKELNYIDDLEKLWYGLYLKFTMELYEQYKEDFFLLKNVIKNTLNQLTVLDGDIICNSYIEEIENILRELDLDVLSERPLILLEKDTRLNKILKTYSSKMQNLCKEYTEIVSTRKLNSNNVLEEELLSKYRTKEEFFSEICIKDFFICLRNNIIPSFKFKLFKEIDRNEAQGSINDEIDIISKKLKSTKKEKDSYSDFINERYIEANLKDIVQKTTIKKGKLNTELKKKMLNITNETIEEIFF